MDAEEIVNSKQERAPALDAAKEFLEKSLANGPVEKKKLEATGETRSFSARTLYNAAKELGVDMKVEGFGKDKKSYWTLNHARSDDTLHE